ncbi:hypothetical protein Tco_1125973, partial [Tanacetum coccineum]
MWPVVESRTIIILPLYKPPVDRLPKKRKKSNDGIVSQSASSGKLFRKGKKVPGQAVGSRKVPGQAVGSRKVSGQAAGAKNVSGQAPGARKASSQPSAAQSTANQGPRQG